MLRIYVDAATKGNPGPSGGGMVVTGEGIHEQLHFPLGECSNHEAEFRMLILAIEWLIEHHYTQTTILLHSDSKIVVQTIEKKYTGNSDFQPYLKKFQELEQQFTLLIIQWIPENKNKGADNLAKQALQKVMK
ncbi:ribonuclease HI family protein [Enterococcus sp. BWT-B8]|uniref:ribonuclease HI family protein n=1 Tax=Enterococcus sp. BWT-B8 TaxID=2885157 RepID=UPI001E29D2E4|nr:ribonuclease HI family protein [Enterococcus sp. BWT-B8]MCB5950840.1 ribonuclease HI family protein [Enterococcus sp. BWT-B8]